MNKMVAIKQVVDWAVERMAPRSPTPLGRDEARARGVLYPERGRQVQATPRKPPLPEAGDVAREILEESMRRTEGNYRKP